jgi:hypothetical protein
MHVLDDAGRLARSSAHGETPTIEQAIFYLSSSRWLRRPHRLEARSYG